MCQRVVCDECGRPGFAGCGRHVEQVLGDVRPEDRCHCREARAQRGEAEPSPVRSWLRSILGK